MCVWQRSKNIGISALSAASLVLLTACAKKQSGPPPNVGPVQVSVTTVEQRDVSLAGDWVATLDGYVNAQIQPQVSGYMIKQDYREGSVVQSGEVLFEIDPRPFQATLDQTEGQLAQARAQLGLADINVMRDTPLAKARAIAQSQLDNDVQQQAAQIAAVRTAEANVEQAQLNLGFTKVRSLVTGIAGRAMTQVGNLVSPSSALTTVSQVNPTCSAVGTRCRCNSRLETAASIHTKDRSFLSSARSTRRREPYRLRAASRIPRTCCVPANSGASR